MPSRTQENDSPVPLLSDKEKIFAKLDKSYWLLGILMVVSLILIQVLAIFNPGWGQSVPTTIHSSIWFLLFGAGLMPVYWVATRKKFLSNKTFVVVWGAILIHLALVLFCRLLFGDVSQTAKIQFEGLMMPYILAPMVVTVLMGTSCGAFATLAVSFLGLGFVAPEFRMDYAVISLIAGMLTVLLNKNMRSRGQLLKSGVIVGLLVFVLASLLGVINYEFPETVRLKIFIWGIVGAFGTSLVLAIIIGGVLPALEGLFKIITPVSWLELSDMNHKLLKQMQLTAPGTFHHCIVVAQLAEAAAEEIRANATHCRVVSYYHDIGKLKYPYYFSENIAEGEKSPHEELTPTMSARIIIGHVADGVELAIANKLNKPIIDTIQQHHGTSLAYYFYRKAMDNRKEMLEQVDFGIANVDDVPEVVESNFRYTGPIPQCRETGIVSLADIVEGATRSLHDPSPEQIDKMIDDVIRARVIEGHLDDSKLTFGDLKKIRNSFAATIKNMRHSRISYPKVEGQEKADSHASLSVEGETPRREDKESGENKEKTPEIATPAVESAKGEGETVKVSTPKEKSE